MENIMDRFLDKLTEKINSQGRAQTQNLMSSGEASSSRVKKEQLDMLENRLNSKLAGSEDRFSQMVVENRKSLDDSLGETVDAARRNLEDSLGETVDASRRSIEQTISEKLAESTEKIMGSRDEQLSRSLSGLDESLGESIDAVRRAIQQDMSQIDEKVKSAVIQGNEEAREQQLAAVKEAMASSGEELKGTLAEAVKAEVVKEVNEQADRNRSDLETAIHKDTVRCYRNTQAVIEKGNTQMAEDRKKTSGKLQLLLSIAIGLMFANLVCAIIIILWIFKVI